MRIQNNIAALNTMRNLGINTGQTAKVTERLSSGFRINRAGDDAAGLYISEKMRSQIRGLNMASKNAQDGISLVQTAEGGLQSAHDILQRMRELAVQFGNDTNVEEDRIAIQGEVDQLTRELDRIAFTTEFNTKRLLDGSLSDKAFARLDTSNVDAEGNSLNAVGIGVVQFDKANPPAAGTIIETVVTASVSNGYEGDDAAATNAIRLTGLTTAIAATQNNQTLSIEIGGVTYVTDVMTASLATGGAAMADFLQTQLSGGLVGSNGKTLAENGVSVAVGAATTEVGGTATATTDLIFTAVHTNETADAWNEANPDETPVVAGTTPLAGSAGNSLVTVGELKIVGGSGVGVMPANAFSEVASVKGILQGDEVAATKATNTLTFGEIKIAASAETSIFTVKLGDFNVSKTFTATAADEVITGATIAEAIFDLIESHADYAKANFIAKWDEDSNSIVLEAKTSGLASNSAVQGIGDVAITGTNASTGANKGNVEADFQLGADKIAAEGEITYEVTIGGAEATLNAKTNLYEAGGMSVAVNTNILEKEFDDDGNLLTTEWNSTTVFDTGNALTLQVGANAGATQTISVGVAGISTDILGLTNGLVTNDVQGPPTDDAVRRTSQLLNVTADVVEAGQQTANESGRESISLIDKALSQVSEQRSALGAVQNRLEFAINNLDTASENLSAAESRIRDLDMAKGMIEFTKNQILTQAATAMLAQANQQPQTVLQLLR